MDCRQKDSMGYDLCGIWWTGKEAAKIEIIPLTAISFLSIFQAALATLDHSTPRDKTCKHVEKVISWLRKKSFSEEKTELSCIRPN